MNVTPNWQYVSKLTVFQFYCWQQLILLHYKVMNTDLLQTQVSQLEWVIHISKDVQKWERKQTKLLKIEMGGNVTVHEVFTMPAYSLTGKQGCV